MRAHIFDMDGTLLRGTTASLLLAKVLGRESELRSLEERFAGGGHTNVEFARTLHEAWGVVSFDDAREALETAPLLRNVGPVLDDIHAHGEHACLITMSPDYFAELLAPLGFDAVYASRFPREVGAALDAADILQFEDKPRLARDFCNERGVRVAEAVAYGDSMSDVPLFEEVGYRISVNGDHHLAEIADVAITGDDLQTAYAHARRWISQR